MGLLATRCMFDGMPRRPGPSSPWGFCTLPGGSRWAATKTGGSAERGCAASDGDGAGVRAGVAADATCCIGVGFGTAGLGVRTCVVTFEFAAAVLTLAGASAGGAGAAGGRSNHQPKAPVATIASTSSGSARPRRRGVANGVPRSGASPRRRFASDFFSASRIRDMENCSQVYVLTKHYSIVRNRCGPASSNADNANSVSGPTTPSGLMP